MPEDSQSDSDLSACEKHNLLAIRMIALLETSLESAPEKLVVVESFLVGTMRLLFPNPRDSEFMLENLKNSVIERLLDDSPVELSN